MTENGLLEQILDRLARSEAGEGLFGASEVTQWPSAWRDMFIVSGLLSRATPARVLTCDGCERNCFKPVTVRVRKDDNSAQAFIDCDEPEDFGRIRVDVSSLEQWHITEGMLARTLVALMGITAASPDEVGGGRWNIGALRPSGPSFSLSMKGSVTLECSGRSVPLIRLLMVDGGRLYVAKDLLMRFIDGDSLERPPEVGSVAWRKERGRAAINARHNKPGGSREKQKKIRDAWASGKYSSRDLCAEQECAGLGMSISAARKALRNTPAPKRRG